MVMVAVAAVLQGGEDLVAGVAQQAHAVVGGGEFPAIVCPVGAACPAVGASGAIAAAAADDVAVAMAVVDGEAIGVDDGAGVRVPAGGTAGAAAAATEGGEDEALGVGALEREPAIGTGA
jgi:hypothetical protein